MYGTLLCGLRCGGITGSAVASGRTEHAHRPIFPIQTCIQFLNVKSHNIPSGHTPVLHVRGGGGTGVHGKGGDLSRAAEKTDTRPVLWSVNYRVFLIVVHRRCVHRTEPEIYWNRLLVSQTEHFPQVFDVS